MRLLQPHCQPAREITQARLDAIREVSENETVRTGDHIEGLVEAWKLATKEERMDLLRMSLDGIYVDSRTDLSLP